MQSGMLRTNDLINMQHFIAALFVIIISHAYTLKVVTLLIKKTNKCAPDMQGIELQHIEIHNTVMLFV